MSFPLATLPDDRLLSRVEALVRSGREVEADLLVHLGEVDARRLYLDQACPSMFAYCVRVLGFAESVAYKRIAAARAARRHPELVTRVRQGDLHVTAASLLAPQLNDTNAGELIAAARRRTADEIRRLLADRKPRPDVAAGIRRAPDSSGAAGSMPMAPTMAASAPARPGARANMRVGGPVRSAAPSGPAPESGPAPAAPESQANGRPPAPAAAWLEPLGGERYLVRFTASPELHAQLTELRALMRHQIPDGDLGKLLAQAVAALLEQVRKQKLADCPAPRSARPSAGPGSRQVPAEIRRAVWKRDGGRCTFRSTGGRRCDARELLEFHHRQPWARSRAHSVDGIALLCRAHNAHEARREFGARHMARFERAGSAPRQLDSNPVAGECWSKVP